MPPPTLTRRGLLRAGALTAAAAATTGTATAATAAPAPDGDALSHLLRRATYGPTPESEEQIRTLGAPAWLARQLDPGKIADPRCAAVLARLPHVGLDIAGVHAAVKAGTIKAFSWDVMTQLGEAAIARAAWSERQLFEVMVDFWSNHLNVASPSDGIWDSRQDYDRTVIRRHALGRFSDMLTASARHPAMLNYLDNRSSTKTHPNENYARELLELHTVGRIYSEPDVKNAALLLTGLTTDHRTGGYLYDPKRHATGRVRIVNWTHANSSSHGEATALGLLDHLARHRSTAKLIARKLCVRFVADEPPASLVDELAAVYLANKTAIVPVLRALFGSAEFAASAGAKLRTPYEDVIASIRTLGLGPEPTGTKALEGLYWMLYQVGHAPLRWPAPNGYPDVATAWASASGFLRRWNGHLGLAAGWWPQQLTRPESLVSHLLPAVPTTYGGLIDALAVRLTGATPSSAHRAALAAFFGKQPQSALLAQHAALNWQFPYLVALILNSPYHQVR